MRSFLPIKGPGGRYLTSREKVALLVLGLTLVLCALTLLAGESAYFDDPGRNPVSGFVAALCQLFGGGLVALYCIVLVWSGLIYFKGEKVARVAPLSGRTFAALAVAIGLSGALGIGQLDSAGRLGLLVGGALFNTVGDVIGFVFMFGLMGLGLNLAGQGAWTALREPVPAGPGAAAGAPGFGFGINAPDNRLANPPLPDDGDPSADERSMAVTQAMEEIERSQGVTIVEMDADHETRSSIGEDVDAAPAPDPETEEAEVQRGLDDVVETLHAAQVADEEEETAGEDDAYESASHGFVPVPSSAPVAEEDELEEEEDEAEEAEYEEDEYEEAGEEDEEEYETEDAYADDDDEEEDDDETEEAYAEEEDEEDEGEYASAEDEEYEDEDEEAAAHDDEYEDDEYEEETAEAEDEGEYAHDEAEEEEEEAVEKEFLAADTAEEERSPYLWETVEEEDEETAEAAPPTDEAGEEEAAEADEGVRELSIPQADGCGDDDEADDPYAQGGLLRRLQQKPAAKLKADDEDPSPYTSFDWRGRPLE